MIPRLKEHYDKKIVFDLQKKFSMRNRYMVPKIKKIVFAARVKYGSIFGWEESYSDVQYEKFYLGGSSNMRGWEILKYKTMDSLGSIPIGGTFRFLTNIECRIKLNQRIKQELL